MNIYMYIHMCKYDSVDGCLSHSKVIDKGRDVVTHNHITVINNMHPHSVGSGSCNTCPQWREAIQRASSMTAEPLLKTPREESDGTGSGWGRFFTPPSHTTFSALMHPGSKQFLSLESNAACVHSHHHSLLLSSPMTWTQIPPNASRAVPGCYAALWESMRVVWVQILL